MLISGGAVEASTFGRAGETGRAGYSGRDGHYSRGAVFMRLRFDGDVDESLVTREGDDIAINLGGLSIYSDFLRSGLPIYVEISAKRGSGSRDTTLHYKVDHRIGN